MPYLGNLDNRNRKPEGRNMAGGGRSACLLFLPSQGLAHRALLPFGNITGSYTLTNVRTGPTLAD